MPSGGRANHTDYWSNSDIGSTDGGDVVSYEGVRREGCSVCVCVCELCEGGGGLQCTLMS